MSTGRSDVLFVFPPAPGNAGAFKNHLGVAYLRAALAREGMATVQYLNGNPGTIDAVAADIHSTEVSHRRFHGVRLQCSLVPLRSPKASNDKSLKPNRVRRAHGNFQCAATDGKACGDRCLRHGRGRGDGGTDLWEVTRLAGLDDTQPGVAFRRDGEVVCTALPPLVGASQPGVQGALDMHSVTLPFRNSGRWSGGSADRAGLHASLPILLFCRAGQDVRCACIRLKGLWRNWNALRSTSNARENHFPVAIFDDAFTLVPPRAKALCKAIADRKLKLALSCITRADTVDEELIELMQEAGFGSIAFGLESAVPSVLRATGKVRPPDWHDPDLAPERQFLERVRNSVLLAKKYGFKVGVSIILGLPTETPADGAETLRFVKNFPLTTIRTISCGYFPVRPCGQRTRSIGIGCTIDKTGLPETTGYSYDLKTLKPGPKCGLEEASTSGSASSDRCALRL